MWHDMPNDQTRSIAREALQAHFDELDALIMDARQKVAWGEAVLKNRKPEYDRVKAALEAMEQSEESDFIMMGIFEDSSRLSIVDAIHEIISQSTAPINREAIRAELENYKKQGKVVRVPNANSLRATLSAGAGSGRWIRHGTGVDDTVYSIPVVAEPTGGDSEVPF